MDRVSWSVLAGVATMAVAPSPSAADDVTREPQLVFALGAERMAMWIVPFNDEQVWSIAGEVAYRVGGTWLYVRPWIGWYEIGANMYRPIDPELAGGAAVGASIRRFGRYVSAGVGVDAGLQVWSSGLYLDRGDYNTAGGAGALQPVLRLRGHIGSGFARGIAIRAELSTGASIVTTPEGYHSDGFALEAGVAVHLVWSPR